MFAQEVQKGRDSGDVGVCSVVDQAEHANEMDMLELKRASI